MVGNRPVVGVRNPVCSTSTPSYLRAKSVGADLPDSGTAVSVNHFPVTYISSLRRRVSPVRLLEAALHPHPKKDEKKY
jgi:hypothetical protein